MFYLLQRFRNLLYMLLSVSFLQEHGARLGCFEQVLSVKALHIDCPNRFLFHNHCCSVNSKVHARSSLNLSHSCIKTCQFAPVALCSSSSRSTIVDNWPALFSYCPGRHGSHCRDLSRTATGISLNHCHGVHILFTRNGQHWILHVRLVRYVSERESQLILYSPSAPNLSTV